MKVVYISDSHDNPGQIKLVESLNRHGWEHQHIYAPFRGLGYKISELAKWCRESGEPEFIMLDAFDTYCLAGPDEWQTPLFSKLMVNGEKHCYPHPEKHIHFVERLPWKYVNSGMIYGRSDYFISLVEKYPFDDAENDQIWYTDRAINKEVQIDVTCNMFQSIAFESEGDFHYGAGMLLNMVTTTMPIFVHGNGKTDMSKIYSL